MSTMVPNVALDALFRRNATLRGDQCALRELGGTALTYTQVSNAVANLAEQIATLGLTAGSSVALLLPGGHECVVSLLAVLRCGHVPVPMPISWRKSDLVRACREAEAAALITTAHFAAENLPELAAEVAIEVFELSFPCAFGEALPDGVLPLSLDTLSEPLLAKAAFSESKSCGVATLAPTSSGVSLVLHSDDELLAAGLGAMLAGDIRGGDTIVSAVSLTSFAGLACALVPWLLSSGTLVLLNDLPSSGALSADKNTHLIATHSLLPKVAALAGSSLASAFAIHFAGTPKVTSFPALNAKAIVDLIAIGEVAAIALPRRERGTIASLPLGSLHAGDGGEAAPIILETAIENGRVQLRGAITPKDILGNQPWLETDYSGTLLSANAVQVTAPSELVVMGALRFNLHDLERRVRAAALISGIFIEADPLLGSRVVITSDRPAETVQALLDAGLPKIVAASVRTAEAVRAKAI